MVVVVKEGAGEVRIGEKDKVKETQQKRGHEKREEWEYENESKCKSETSANCHTIPIRYTDCELGRRGFVPYSRSSRSLVKCVVSLCIKVDIFIQLLLKGQTKLLVTTKK